MASRPATNQPAVGTHNRVNEAMLDAMSSPIRMRILGTLRVNGTQTVGDISEQLGEAPGAVSYHLAQLAKVGLAEKSDPVDGDRRKSWWQACQNSIQLDSKDSDKQSKEVDLFLRSAALSYEMSYERYRDAVPSLPKEWVETGTSEDHVLPMTNDEMKSMLNDLSSVFEKWSTITKGRHGGENGIEQVAFTLQAYRWIP